MKQNMLLESFKRNLKFKFHYVQMKLYPIGLVLLGVLMFKFHYVQMKPARIGLNAKIVIIV